MTIPGVIRARPIIMVIITAAASVDVSASLFKSIPSMAQSTTRP